MPTFQISQRLKNVLPSLTLAITAKAQALKAAGKDVIGFGAGEPDFDTPDVIKQAAKLALDQGKTKYTEVDGIHELKKAIEERLFLDHGLRYALDEIAVTSGGKQAIFNLILAMINPGDGVLIPAPYWVSYPDQVLIAEGEPQIISTRADEDYKLTAADLEKAIRPNSKLLILNSPSNPAGATLSKEDLAAIAAVVIKHDLWVMSDEIYDKLVYDGFKQTSIAELPGMFERTVIVNGLSKAYSMTGWRMGYMAGPKPWVRAAVKLQGQSTSNPTSIAQYASVKALQLDDHDLEYMRQAFEERRNVIVDLLNDIPGVVCPKPLGAFYVLPNIEKAIAGRFASAQEFSEALLEKQLVAVVPGEGFGAPGCMRLSYATSLDNIKRGVARIKDFLS